MKTIRISLYIVISITIIGTLINWYVDRQLAQKKFTDVYNRCDKIWAARGLYNFADEQNSIASFQRAFSQGAVGGEVDFYYDVPTDDFIVSHDRPTKDRNGKNVYRKMLTLEELLATTAKDHYFWFDYKNLDRLTDKQTISAIKRLKEITTADSIVDRVYIEGSNPIELSKYTDAGFNTILGIHPLPASSIFSGIVIKAYKIAYYFNNITAIALPYGKGKSANPIYSATAAKKLANVPRFVFHVPNNERILTRLMEDDNVKVVLVGNNLSVNRYDVSACQN